MRLTTNILKEKYRHFTDFRASRFKDLTTIRQCIIIYAFRSFASFLISRSVSLEPYFLLVCATLIICFLEKKAWSPTPCFSPKTYVALIHGLDGPISFILRSQTYYRYSNSAYLQSKKTKNYYIGIAEFRVEFFKYAEFLNTVKFNRYLNPRTNILLVLILHLWQIFAN